MQSRASLPASPCAGSEKEDSTLRSLTLRDVRGFYANMLRGRGSALAPDARHAHTQAAAPLLIGVERAATPAVRAFAQVFARPRLVHPKTCPPARPAPPHASRGRLRGALVQADMAKGLLRGPRGARVGEERLPAAGALKSLEGTCGTLAWEGA